MDAVTLLRNQLTGVHAMYREVVETVTPDEWTARAHPGANPPGFLAWHMPAVRDWAVHVWCRGVPEVRVSSTLPGVNPPHPPFGMSIDEAEAIARAVSREDVLAYADAVHEATMAYLDTLTDADLDTVPDTRAHSARVSAYHIPGYMEEVSDMYDFPIWRTLGGPCYGHSRGHLGEMLAALEALRAP
jgi:hypothetical protein